MSQNHSDDIIGSYRWPELIKGTLIKRYKRFLADIRLENGEIVTAHCPNSGAMRACCEPGMPVYISSHDNPRRKLKYTWEMIQMPGSLVGINTMVPNRLVAGAIEAGLVPALSGYLNVKREVTVGNRSRLDLMLEGDNRPDCYVEVKNCTLVETGEARFPDAVTKRGRKHLVELRNLAGKGFRCVMFFLVQRMDARYFIPAADIDPEYAVERGNTVQNNGEIIVYDVNITLERIMLRGEIPFSLYGIDKALLTGTVPPCPLEKLKFP